MKLNAVVESKNVESKTQSFLNTPRGAFGRSLSGVLLLAFAAALLLAAPASALDGIDLSEAAEPAAAGECPALIKIKYPFLSCSNGQIGMTSKSATWDNSRQIPRQSDFNEGNGYWGAELNTGWTR